jgi:hypothetical protein
MGGCPLDRSVTVLSEHERRVLREIELNLSSMAADAWPRRVARAARLPTVTAGLVTVLCLAGVAAPPSGAALALTVVLALMTGWQLRRTTARAGWFARNRFYRIRRTRNARRPSSNH